MPGQMNFYRNKGALQVTFIPPTFNDKGFIDKQGSMLFVAAPGISNDPKNPAWDWNQQVRFAVSLPDIAALYEGEPNDRWESFHQLEGVPKKLIVEPGMNSGYMMSIAVGKNDTRKAVYVPLSVGQWILLKTELKRMVPYLAGYLPC